MDMGGDRIVGGRPENATIDEKDISHDSDMMFVQKPITF
jgi:hypothetical protein